MKEDTYFGGAQQKKEAMGRCAVLRDELTRWIEKGEVPHGTVVFFFSYATGDGTCFSHGLSSDDVADVLGGFADQISGVVQPHDSKGEVKIVD
jgi:hypothetical protein